MHDQVARRGSRRRNSGAKSTKKLLDEQLLWQVPSYADAPTEPLSQDQVEAIHETSLRVLEELGILFLNDEALKVLEAEGCDVDWSTKNVRFDRGYITEQLKKRHPLLRLRPEILRRNLFGVGVISPMVM